MKNIICVLILMGSVGVFAQAGHLMHGAGAVNISMGGAATGQPLDISGALMWNPAAVSTFDNTILNVDLGLFFSAPELSSSLPAGMMGTGSPAVSGTTKDEKGLSPMPALAMVWGKPESKHTFGLSVFGVSGFGVDFPEETNLPTNGASWDPTNSNPISYPQNMGGFGHITSNYMLLQVGLTYAYNFSDKFSVGIQPLFNYGALEVGPNPLASPSMDFGYPQGEDASSVGFGAQVGLFYDSGTGFKMGASYKTKQSMGEMTFTNTYLNNTAAPDVDFTMNYPAILSVGMGYSTENFDLAVDYRTVDYENTEGFEESGWTNNFSVAGFGWKNINIISAGLQYKGIEKLPLRVGYTYSSNPINEDVAFFSVSAPAIIKNAFQFGMGYEASDKFKINAVYHHGSSGDATEGNLLSPMMVSASNPYGAIPGTKVGYSMTTDLVMLGISYNFSK